VFLGLAGDGLLACLRLFSEFSDFSGFQKRQDWIGFRQRDSMKAPNFAAINFKNLS
jgi:hypothetical protein